MRKRQPFAALMRAIALKLSDNELADFAFYLDSQNDPPFQDLALEVLDTEIAVRCPEVFDGLEVPLPEDAVKPEDIRGDTVPPPPIQHTVDFDMEGPVEQGV